MGLKHSDLSASQSVARLLAVTYLPYGDKGNDYVVMLKNGDGSDLRPENLVWMSHKEAGIYNLKNAKDSESKYRGNNNQKQINQYSIDGKWLNYFKTIVDAANKTGVDESNIREVTSGRSETAGGFLWKLVGDEFPKGEDIEGIDKPPRVIQYSLDGKYIDDFYGPKAAADATGLKRNPIGNAIREKYKYGGFQWRYESDEYITGKDIKPYKNNSNKGVNKYSLDGKYIENFTTFTKADNMGYNRQSVRRVIKNKTPYKGYLWRLESEHPRGVDLA